MGTNLNPYISFDGNARDAMEFYRSALGGELTTSTFGELDGDPDSGYADQIMHSQLEADGKIILMASDTPPGMAYNPGQNITISLSGDDADTLRGYWDRLSAGGNVTVELAPQMWGDEFGSFTDKFGIGWLVNIAGAQNAAQRAAGQG